MAHKSIALNQSLLYDGGGTSNALQTFTTSATLVAATLDTVRISGPIAALRIDLLASAAGKGCVLAITEFRDDSPAVSEILSVREVAIPATDQTMTVDRASWGLTTATEIYAKAAVVVPVTPGRYVTISCASTDGSVSWYARVTGLDNQSASAEVNVDSASNLGNVGLVNAAETEINPATEDKQDDIKTALQLLTNPLESSTSTLYVGNGTTGNELQDNQAACALLATADHVAAVISVGANNILEVFVQNASNDTTDAALTLSVREYSAATPTLATMIRAIAVSTGAMQTQTVDRSNVGLTTGTVHYPKTPIRLAVTPNTYITLAIIENITGLAYCRYQLKSAL